MAEQLKQEDGLRNSMFLARLAGIVGFSITLGKITDEDFIEEFNSLMEYYEYNVVPHAYKKDK